MATQVEERRQSLVELNTRIKDREGVILAEDHMPTAEEESELEAMYNARADIREDLARHGRLQERRGGNQASDDVPAVVSRDRGQNRIVTLGERFVTSPQYTDWHARAGDRLPDRGNIPTMDRYRVGGFRELGIYTDLITGGSSTSGGAFVVTDRDPTVVGLGRRQLTIRDLISIVRTSSDLVEFVRQTSRTNNAAPVAEATAASGSSGVKPESAAAFEVVQTPVKTIANWMPVTRQAVADVPQMRDIIDTELRDNLSEEFDEQVIAGDGTGQNFTGILETANTQAQAWDTNILTTTRKARTKVRTVGRRTPNGYVLHPTDWETIDLLQDNEARYYFGGPSVMGTPRLWGLPVVENEAVGVGTGIVGDFTRARAWDREDTQILVSDSHSDFFIRNLLAVLAELRAAFGVLQPSAFVEIDLTS